MKWLELLARPRILTFFVLLVVAAFVAEPLSFAKAWNEGRSAMLAIVPLVGLEMWTKALGPVTRRKAALGYSVIAVAFVYYVMASLQGVRESLISSGVGLGVDPLIAQYSWVWGFDYAVTSLFLLALVMLLSRPRVITPFIYTVGMVCFLYIDVVLPYNSLGPFQYVVPPVLGFVVLVLNATGLGHSSVAGNILHLSTATGSMNLQVYWPSAGLQGIVIGLLAVATISVKLGSGWTRGSIYMVIGVVGSFLVNVLRIVLLAVYAMGAINDPKGFERFHSVAGELVFIPWILILIVLVVRHELKIKTRTGASSHPESLSKARATEAE